MRTTLIIRTEMNQRVGEISRDDNTLHVPRVGDCLRTPMGLYTVTEVHTEYAQLYVEHTVFVREGTVSR